MRISKTLLNKALKVIFFDHAKNGSILKCLVVGQLAKIEDNCIKLVNWDCFEEQDISDRIENMEYVSILKDAIIEIYKYDKEKLIYKKK